MTTTPQDGARMRHVLLASAKAARELNVWNAAAVAGWLLQQAGGDAYAAISLDAPVSALYLARARSYLLSVVHEECPASRRAASSARTQEAAQ